MKRSMWTILVLWVGSAVGASPPWEAHGIIHPDPSGHKLQHEDGTPFLWIGDTAWGMFQQLTREQVDQYLDQRQALGFNVIQSVVFWYPHGGGLPSGPHNAANAYGHRPFVGGEDTPDTAQPLIVPGGTAEAPNDYWDHVDYVMAAVRKRGMYLALLPCWGRAYITMQMGPTHEEFNEREARAYGEFLGSRFKSEPNVLWVLGGDAKAQIRAFEHDIFVQFDKRAVFRAMAEGIAHGVTGQRPVWNKPHPAWKKVFMTYHPDGDADWNSSNWFHDDAWLTANGIEVWREIDEVHAAVLRDYQMSPSKPTLFLEGSYEFGSYRHECGWVTPLKSRRQAYHSFFAGASGFTYGAGPIWAMRSNGGDYNCGYSWQQALEFPGATQFAVTAQAFLRQHHWFRWVPDGRVVNGWTGDGESHRVAVVLTDNSEALVYFTSNIHSRVRNVLGKSATAQWFDPRDGQTTTAGSFAVDEVRLIAPPGGWEDAVLILTAQQ